MTRSRRLAVIAVAALPIVGGAFVLQERATRDGARLFDQVISLVADRFVDTVDNGALYEKAARGLVEELNDPYSELLTPKQLQRFSTTSTGRYGGLGMRIEDQDGQITVVQVFRNTPAEGAGIQEGDRIVGVDTGSTRGWTTEQVSNALTGTPGTQVTVRFVRPGVDEVITHKLTRAMIHIPAVPFALTFEGGIGYIPLESFNESATEELEDSFDRLIKGGARSLILDLRRNPGGILDQGLAVADVFLDHGDEIASVRGRAAMAQRWVAKGRQRFPDMPLIVMLDGYSASASEIVAGALQDHDRALIVGTTSFGKGLVQTVFPLEGGYALKLTTAKWFTPVGRSIQKDRKDSATVLASAGGGAAGANMTQRGDGRRVEAPPDSLETDSVKKGRPAFRSDAGRLIYGGGGITPDVIVPDDTVSTAEQEFLKAVTPKAPQVRVTLWNYAQELKKSLPSATADVQQAWRDEFYRRLQAAKVPVDRKLYDAARPTIDRWLAHYATRFAFGDSAAFRREAPTDPQLVRAMELMRKGSTQKDLFAVARVEGASAAKRVH